MPKKAIIAISFGTTYLNAQCALEKIENHLKSKAPSYDIFRAYTSRVVIKKLKAKQNISVKTPSEMLEHLLSEGYNCVSCQSLHVIRGIEYEKMCADIQPFVSKFDKLSVGTPLLDEPSDFQRCQDAIIAHVPPLKSDELLLLMGHGSEHAANSAYATMGQLFELQGYHNVLVGTIEGKPNFDDILAKIDSKKFRKIYLMPLMIVAGDHAQNDLAGDSENSWKSILEKKGFEVYPILQGLGEFDEICDIFGDHIKI